MWCFALISLDFDEYIRSGFAALQRNLDRAFIETWTEGQSPEFVQVSAKWCASPNCSSNESHSNLVFIQTVAIREIPAERTRSCPIHRYQANGNIRGDHLQLHGIAEHDPGADGGGEGLRRHGIPANRIRPELLEQCDIFLHESTDRLHHLRRHIHRGRLLSTARPRHMLLAASIAVLVPDVGHCVHIPVDRCIRFR